MNDNTITTNSEWPYNLLNELEMEPQDPLENADDIANMEIAMGLSGLTPREKIAIRMRFAQEHTLKETGEALGVQQERARQILARATRKLRASTPRYILMHGIRAYVEKRIAEGVATLWKAKKEELEKIHEEEITRLSDEEARKKAETSRMERAYATTLEELGLSLRGYNVLKRVGCSTVYDIVSLIPDYARAVTVRNMGRKTLDEIHNTLMAYGIFWPADYKG